jgi:hypothetical protein
MLEDGIFEGRIDSANVAAFSDEMDARIHDTNAKGMALDRTGFSSVLDVHKAERLERKGTSLEPWAWFVFLAGRIWDIIMLKEYRLMYAQWMRENVLVHADEMIASLNEMEGLMAQ